MRKIQIFVLILIVGLPLSGCIDGADTDEESENQTISSTNHHPVIYGFVEFSDYQHYPNSTSPVDALVSVNYAHAIDFDGNITQFGVDTNQDGEIDLEINQSRDGPGTKLVNGSESDSWKNPTEYFFSGTSDVFACYQWLSIIAVDDDGDITVKPFIISFDYDTQNNECLMSNGWLLLS
ncbi:MAG: hypothetical protein VW982_07560 [Candidatus Poseidoniales archaeon]|jgi:hypothetical protein